MKATEGQPGGAKQEREYADRVHIFYAKTLDFVSHAVIVAMVIGYVLYLTGLLPLSIPIGAIAGNWHLSAAEMQATLHHPKGWSFVTAPGGVLQGDIVSYMSVILLALATLFCLAVAVVVYLREKKPLFFTIALGQFLVLVVAASGIVAAGR
ncbi:MAG TPA: DUF1634 domain-containing protein [Chlorobaculum parvum]|uniref:DUF1634 domain-containing protein n=1 Tax=Chlorobaculum parvum TaxID=274539 RepID=A0A7C5H7T6_9CHLB|nr:DUF1634 domain-containing protein [Chlorobaculum parvum]